MSQETEYSFAKADEDARTVMRECRRLLDAGLGKDGRREFEVLCQAAFEYHQTRGTAADRRKRNMLTPEWEADEREALRKFLNASKPFESFIHESSK